MKRMGFDFDTDVELDKLDGGQTNDEWRRTCSAEEFAEEIVNLAEDDFKKLRDMYYGIANDDKDALVMWLKEKHE